MLILAYIDLGTQVMPISAYLDPTTGALVLQTLLGGFFVVLVMIRFYWNRLKQVFTRKDSPKEDIGSSSIE